MKCVTFTLMLLTLSACAKVPGPPNCSHGPKGFYTWRDISVGIDGYSGNTIRVTNDTIFWNDVDLTNGEDGSAMAILDQYLGQTARMEPVPFVTITFREGVACSRINAIRTLMEKNLSCHAIQGKCLQGALPGRLD